MFNFNCLKTGIAICKITVGIVGIYILGKPLHRMSTAKTGLKKNAEYWVNESSQIDGDEANFLLSETIRYIDALDNSEKMISLCALIFGVLLIIDGAVMIGFIFKKSLGRGGAVVASDSS